MFKKNHELAIPLLLEISNKIESKNLSDYTDNQLNYMYSFMLITLIKIAKIDEKIKQLEWLLILSNNDTEIIPSQCGDSESRSYDTCLIAITIVIISTVLLIRSQSEWSDLKNPKSSQAELGIAIFLLSILLLFTAYLIYRWCLKKHICSKSPQKKITDKKNELAEIMRQNQNNEVGIIVKFWGKDSKTRQDESDVVDDDNHIDQKGVSPSI